MSDTNFLTQLVAAQQALEAKPQLEAELARANGERDTIRTRFEAETAHSATLREMLNSKGAEVEAKEAELKAATFREQQLRDQLTLLLGSLKGIVSESNTAIELVEPKPEPIVEAPIENPTSQNNGNYGETHTGNDTVSAVDSLPDAVSVSSDPTATSASFPPTENGAENGEGASTIGTETSDTDPVDLPGKFPWETPKIGDAEDYSYMHTAPNNGEHGRLSKEEMEAAREPEVNPTAMQPSETNGASVTASVGSNTETPVHPASTPDETKYYWHKPTTQTWGDWVDAGGEIAPWLKNYPREQLNFAF